MYLSIFSTPTCIHAYNVHTYTHTHIHTHTYIHTYISSFIRKYMHTHTYIHKCTNTCMHTYSLQAEQNGVIKRYLVFVQDHDQNFVCDSSSMYQGWLRDAAGFSKTLEDIGTGKFRARATSVEEMNRMMDLYPTYAAAVKLLSSQPCVIVALNVSTCVFFLQKLT
jgi:hypothetical protein